MKVASSFVAKWCAAPYRLASSCLSSVRDRTVTSAPMATAILTAMWPRPPMPMTATFLPGPAPQRFSGL